MRISYFLLLFCLLFTLRAEVPSYFVLCSEEEFQYMNSHWQEEIEIECTVVVEDTVYTGCSMRIRGDSSRGFPKKSYRITFSMTDPLDGRSRWNFNAEYLDESYMHTWFFARILDELDYPCFDVEYAMLYVNDNYRGLYIRCEPIDELFLLVNGLDPDGNLYKAAIDGACLSIWDNVMEVWEKRTNEGQGWNDLFELIADIESSPPDSVLDLVSNRFHLNDLLTISSINLLTSNTSTYYHNYFLYHDIWNSNRWTMLPWDVDKTFWSTGWPYYFPNNQHWHDNPLHRKLMLDPFFLEMLFARMNAICESVFNGPFVDPLLDSLQIELSAAVDADTLDNTDLAGFLASSDSIGNWFIPGRMAALQYEYDHTCRPFSANRGDSAGVAGYSASWATAYDPDGDPVTYKVTVSTVLWNPDSIVAVYENLTDTCLTITGLDPGGYIWKVQVEQGWRIIEAYDRCNRFEIYEGTLLSGVLQGTTYLTYAGSPYLVTGDITIPSGSALYVEAGVELRFSGGTRLTCNGSIQTTGNSQDSVRFCSDIQSESWAGILLSSGQKSTFEYTVFSGTTGYGEQPQHQAGLCVLNRDIDLLNCSFRDNLNCVKVIDGNVTIRFCDFSGGNSGELFIIGDGKGALIEDSSFGNLIDPPSDVFDAVEFVNCTDGDFIVRRCHIWNIYGDGIDSNGSDISCSDNIIHDILDKGISLGTWTGGMGIPFEAELTGNIIYSCSTGIAVKDGIVALLDRTTVSMCGTGISLYEKTPEYGGGYAEVVNSIFWDNDTTALVDPFSTLYIDYSLTGNEGPWPGTGNIATDPFFLNQQDGDYHLRFDSPCIDAGIPGDLDPDGTRADMGAIFFPQVFDQLFINELQASNLTTIADAWGDYGDWLEIHNSADWDADLSWVYLSDDPSEPDMWRFPSGTLVPANGFLLVWADDDYWKAGLHLPWRLAASGDSIYLSVAVVESGRTVVSRIDEIEFGSMPPDSSYGRLPDGGSEWRLFVTPTPGYSNGGVGPFPGFLAAGYPFPNPCFGSVLALDLEIDQGWTTVSVYDLSGRLIRILDDRLMVTGLHRIWWDLLTADGIRVPDGVYLILSEHAGAIPVARKAVVLQQQ